MYAFTFIWNQASRSAMQPATLKFCVHHAVLKCENGTDVIVEGTWQCRLNSSPRCALNIYMQARYRSAKFQET